MTLTQKVIKQRELLADRVFANALQDQQRLTRDIDLLSEEFKQIEMLARELRVLRMKYPIAGTEIDQAIFKLTNLILE